MTSGGSGRCVVADAQGVIATSGSIEIDRIGACAEAEENVRKRVSSDEDAT